MFLSRGSRIFHFFDDEKERENSLSIPFLMMRRRREDKSLQEQVPLRSGILVGSVEG